MVSKPKKGQPGKKKKLKVLNLNEEEEKYLVDLSILDQGGGVLRIVVEDES